MALFKQLRGNRASLNTQPLHDGYAYFCIDDGSFWIDYNDNGELKRKRINAAELDSKIGVVDDTIEITALNGIEMNGPTHIVGDTNVEGALYQDGDAVATQDWVRANAGGGGDVIIDVDVLPTENIDDKAIYRVSEGEVFSTLGGVKNIVGTTPVTFYIVDSLPEVGEYITDADRSYIRAYYQKSNNLVYGYVPGALTGGSDMWVGIDLVIGLLLDSSIWGGYLTYDEYKTGAYNVAQLYIVSGGQKELKYYNYTNNEWHEIITAESVNNSILLRATSTLQEFRDAFRAFKYGNKTIKYYLDESVTALITNMETDPDYEGQYVKCTASLYTLDYGVFMNQPGFDAANWPSNSEGVYSLVIEKSHLYSETKVSILGPFATQAWVLENVSGSGDDSNYAKLDSTNIFSTTTGYNSTQVGANGVKVETLSSGVIPYSLEIQANKIIKQDSGQIAEYTFDTTAGGVLATQEWVAANGGGGGSTSTSSASYVGSNGYSVTIDPNATNPILIDAGMGIDNPNGLKISSNMMYLDSVVYKSTGISATIANDYGNITQTVTNLQFPRNEDSASNVTNTLNIPNSSGTIATQEWVEELILGGAW